MQDHHYPALGKDPRELRPKNSNRLGALLLLGFLAVVIMLVMLFG